MGFGVFIFLIWILGGCWGGFGWINAWICGWSVLVFDSGRSVFGFCIPTLAKISSFHFESFTEQIEY